MDHHSAILESLPGLKEKLDRAGVQGWLKERPRVEVEGKTYFVIAGDRLASEAEAMISFALEHQLVSPADVQSAAAGQPLPPGVEAVDIDKPKGGK
jgi:hypothetical protein